MRDEDSTVDDVKLAVRTATKIATDALRETPSMSEITVEYQDCDRCTEGNALDERDYC